ncbi:MAG TPA: DMT family transporter [Panacibacter sp.]|nr:DMT family transporter [Panacibacter sp.]HNP45100.1 DMT family transporter [Panacibacter sp.]
MKMSDQLSFILLALCAGMMIPFQSAMNAQLGKALQSPYYAALSVFVIAAIGLSLYILANRYVVPSTQQFSGAPTWSYLGGILGGAYILLIVLCAPRLGIGNVTVLVLLGQILSALLIDQFGLLRSPVHVLNIQRIIGVILVIAGVYLVKKF